MSEYWDAIVWIDRREASIFQVGVPDEAPIVVHCHTSNQAVQGTESIDVEFFHRVAAALDLAGGILLTGPGNLKFELKNYLDEHHPALAARVSGVETLEHAPTSELLTMARRFFQARGRRHNTPLGADTLRKDTRGAAQFVKQ